MFFIFNSVQIPLTFAGASEVGNNPVSQKNAVLLT